VLPARVAVGVTAVRARTERFEFEDAPPATADSARDAERSTTVRFATLRDVARETVVFDWLLRGLARPERTFAPARVAWGPFCAALFIGAIGSAKTERIDNNVEHVKNAPPSKNIVPTAFLQQSEKLRLFINHSPTFWKRPENMHFNVIMPCIIHVYFV
jgi:hypothetical protein